MSKDAKSNIRQTVERQTPGFQYGQELLTQEVGSFILEAEQEPVTRTLPQPLRKFTGAPTGRYTVLQARAAMQSSRREHAADVASAVDETTGETLFFVAADAVPLTSARNGSPTAAIAIIRDGLLVYGQSVTELVHDSPPVTTDMGGVELIDLSDMFRGGDVTRYKSDTALNTIADFVEELS